MAESDKTYRVFISAVEPSGDAHCASLITAMKDSAVNIEFVGIGGPRMQQAGCRLLETTTSKAAMTYNVFKHLLGYYRLIRRIKRFLKSERPDIVIVCDSPAFNFHIAKAAKAAGIKTLFYVAPQLWAWAEWRIGKLKKYCDKLCCILAFEQDWFRQRGVDAVFVGNPLLDELDSDLKQHRKSYSNFNPENAEIVLLPGSRDAEIKTLWLAMQQIVIKLRRKYPAIAVTTVAVDDEKKEVLRSMQILGFRCNYVTDSVIEVARRSDFAVVASGSATLQVAAAGCPMVIMYQSSRFLWHTLGRWLINTKFLSLVNILAQRRLVPEYMPYFRSTAPIVETIETLLSNKSRLIATSGELVELVTTLKKNKACERTAQIVLEMLDSPPPQADEQHEKQ